MVDFRVHDSASEHPKLRAAGPAAAGLWAMSGSYCMRPDVLSDGWVPLHYVTSWPNGRKLAATLVRVGLWRKEERNGLPGYQFHDWLDIQRSAASVHADRESARDRMARLRKRNKVDSSSPNVRPNKDRTFGRTSGERSPESPSGRENGLPPSRTPGNTQEDAPDGDAKATVDNSHEPPAISENDGAFGRTSPEVPPMFNDSQSLSQSPSGDLGREGHPGQRARETPPPPETPGQRPADRCPKHVDATDPPPCRDCRDARLAAEAFDEQQTDRRALITEAIDEARRDPRQRCKHDTDGGAFLHPDTGKSATCALCRRASEREAS